MSGTLWSNGHPPPSYAESGLQHHHTPCPPPTSHDVRQSVLVQGKVIDPSKFVFDILSTHAVKVPKVLVSAQHEQEKSSTPTAATTSGRHHSKTEAQNDDETKAIVQAPTASVPAPDRKTRWNDHTIFWWLEPRHFNWVNFFLLLVVIFGLVKTHKAHTRDAWCGDEFKEYLTSLKSVGGDEVMDWKVGLLSARCGA